MAERVLQEWALPLQASQDSLGKHALLSDCRPQTKRLLAQFLDGGQISAMGSALGTRGRWLWWGGGGGCKQQLTR